MPDGVSLQQLYDFITSIFPGDAPKMEMLNYARNDFLRFVYTYNLVASAGEGECLELGSNPYFTTMLLKRYTKLNLSLANYFGAGFKASEGHQSVFFRPPSGSGSGDLQSTVMDFCHFNIEQDVFPYSNNTFDVVVFCEIIEHLLHDPQKVLLDIKRVLKPHGVLVLTTPNVARLENVAKLLVGANIYDPYSGYGPYGRHNREYNRHELVTLLNYLGFKVEVCFTADVHKNLAGNFFSEKDLFYEIQKIKNRLPDLGQYIFLRAIKQDDRSVNAYPDFLYRSYPDGKVVPV